MKSNARNYWNGARCAGIRGIHLRTVPTLDICDFSISAACYEHRHYIGHSLPRIDNFVGDLLAVLAAHANQTFAWCVLPNHYHALVEAADIKRLVYQLGRLHGRTSHAWNGEERTRGRKVFFRAVERAMRSDATLQGSNDVELRSSIIRCEHGYVERWERIGRGAAQRNTRSAGQVRARRSVLGEIVGVPDDPRRGTRQELGMIQKV